MRQKLRLLLLSSVLLVTSAFAGDELRATPGQLSDYYPYALMSYLSDVEIVFGRDALEQQLFFIFRLSYLADRGIRMVTDAEDIPAKWRPYFTHVGHGHCADNGSDSIGISSGNPLVDQIILPDSGVTARVFLQTTDLAPEGKIILAFAGEQSGGFFPCLLSEPKDSGVCAPIKQQLQDIAELVSDFRDEYPGYGVDVVGYSYSGALVQALMSTATLVDHAYIFNSYSAHPGWLTDRDDERLHHAYIEGSLLYSNDFNILSRYSRWRLPQQQMPTSGIALSARGLEPNLRQIYRLNHRDSWLDTLYNLLTTAWVLHSKEALLRTFEVHLGFDFPW